jgi:hypothetical protein
MLAQQPEWGLISKAEDKAALLAHMHTFEADIRHKISNLRGDVALQQPSPPYDTIEQKPAAYAAAARNSDTLDHFMVRDSPRVLTHARAHARVYYSVILTHPPPPYPLPTYSLTPR